MMEYILSRLMARLNEVEEKMKGWNGFGIFKLKVEGWMLKVETAFFNLTIHKKNKKSLFAKRQKLWG
jgi:hypothetical protein